MSDETQKLGEWFNGPVNAKNIQAGQSDIALAHSAFKHAKSDTQQILEAIAALAAGIGARDRQLSAISEQIGHIQHFLNSEVIARNSQIEAMEIRLGRILERLETAIKGKERYPSPAWIGQKLEQRLAGLDSKLSGILEQSQRWQGPGIVKLAAPKQKQRRKRKA